MKSIVAQVRNLLTWLVGDDDSATRTSFKRDRNDDDFSSDEDSPALKRLKKLRRTSFPSMWNEEEKQNKNVRLVPIQVEHGHPSTSTPNEEYINLGSRLRTVPVKLVTQNGPTTPTRKSHTHIPVRPVIQAVIDDEDEDDQDVTYVETKTKPNAVKSPKLFINLDEDENDNLDDDVIFVEKIKSPPSVQPYKFYLNTSNDTEGNDNAKYYKICRKLNERSASNSPKTYSKFKNPAGISKVYKKPPVISKWLQPQKANLSQSKNKYSSLNGNTRSTLSEVFNLNEKRNYQELIRKVADAMKPVIVGKHADILDIAEESNVFRLTQRAQKSALNEIRLVEKGLDAKKDNETTTEYDPITVASITSSDSEVEIVPSEGSTSSSVRIDPINTLRDSYRDRAVTSGDWLSRLDTKYKKKKQVTQEKLKDAHRESDIISKVNHEQNLAHLEHKLKYELSIPESLIEEPQPVVELPPLTPEQEKLINKALGTGPPGQLLVEKFNLRIHRRDLQTLKGLNWLNDEVINFYMNLLMQRSDERKDLPKVYATNTFFYPKLMQSGQAGLKRWTRKVDIFAHDLMVVPVHLGVHWCLSLIDFREKKISYLDSMGGRNQACLNALLQYLRDEHRDKKGQPFDEQGWTTENLKDIPQQMNGSDCGMFLCTFAEFSSRGAPYTFSQAHMPYLRRKAVLEILQAKLLL